MSLATRLKDARLRQHKTQQQLAEEVGIKQQAIQRIEAGKVKRTSYVVHIAKALQISSDWLAFGPNDEPIPVPVGVQEHTTQYNKRFSSVPLFFWNDIPQQLSAAEFAKGHHKYVPCFSSVSEHAFAMQLEDLNDSMISPDGKVNFQRNDIVIVEPTKVLKDGSFVLAAVPKVVIRKYVSEASTVNKDYLVASNPKYESVTCDEQVKIYGTIVEKIILFS